MDGEDLQLHSSQVGTLKLFISLVIFYWLKLMFLVCFLEESDINPTYIILSYFYKSKKTLEEVE